MLKVSAFYLEKQKSFIPKKKKNFGRSQYQNKKTLFPDSIFREGFDLNNQKSLEKNRHTVNRSAIFNLSQSLDIFFNPIMLTTRGCWSTAAWLHHYHQCDS